jgi:hypothetical protein
VLRALCEKGFVTRNEWLLIHCTLPAKVQKKPTRRVCFAFLTATLRIRRQRRVDELAELIARAYGFGGTGEGKGAGRFRGERLMSFIFFMSYLHKPPELVP